MRKFLPGVLIALFICYGCRQTSKPVAEDEIQEDGIEMRSLTDAGVDSAAITLLTKELYGGTYPNIHSVLIAKDNKLVYERYLRGQDNQWGEDVGIVSFTRDSLHDVRSISKSVVSACIGLAIAQGKIKNVDQPIAEFFPNLAALKEGKKSTITIKHLLTMTSGIKWNEEVPYDDPENSEIQMIRSADPIAYVFSQPLETNPGEVWKYSGGSTQVLAGIIEKATGQKVDAFAKAYLFDPIGVKKFTWTKFPNTDNPAAASGLRLRPRDLLKFGLLYANGGKWLGQQLLPADWVKTSMESAVTQARGGYGYQFWTWRDTIQNSPINMVACIGNGDQRVFMDASHSLVVVTTAGNYNKWNIEKNAYALLRDLIYPALLK